MEANHQVYCYSYFASLVSKASFCFFLFPKSRGGHRKGAELPIKPQCFVSLNLLKMCSEVEVCAFLLWLQ